MNCQSCRERMTEYADGRLGEREAAQVREHLEGCAGCAHELASARELLALVDRLPSAPPTHRMRARLAGAIETEKLALEKAQAQPAPQRRGLRPWLIGLQALGAAAVLAFGFVLGEHSASQRQLAELRARVDTMGMLVEQSVLQKQPTGARLETVLTAATTRRPDERLIDGLINTMAFDPSINVRLNALNALYAHADQEVVRAGVLACLKREPNPLVQVSMIDFLVGSRAREAAPELRLLAVDPKADADVREAAQRATDLL